MKKINVGFVGPGINGFAYGKKYFKKKHPLIVWSRSKKIIKILEN